MAVHIAGIRPPPTSPRWNDGRLHFAEAGDVPLQVGDWVVVDGVASEPWIGEVIVAPEQIVEATPFGDLPRVLRPADATERPAARTEGAGLSVLRSLDLPDWATRPGSAGPASAAPPSSDDERPQ